MNEHAAFDRFADEYDAELEAALEVSGEDRAYFAKGRVSLLGRCLDDLRDSPKRGLDFGCGVGTTAPLLREQFGLDQIIGVDVSPRSIKLAQRQSCPGNCRFSLINEYEPDGTIDLAYCNGVFHHIPLSEREAAVGYVYRALRSAGLFALWENHSWNPGTRYVMSKCSFDKDAIPLTPSETRGLLSDGGFQILRTDFAFIFPRALKVLRPLEKQLQKLPLGAQYQVLARKPG
ncbi:MAG TPA: class I SAM-dependent methyltransferase [Candidatus Acidoferrales bacterium]